MFKQGLKKVTVALLIYGLMVPAARADNETVAPALTQAPGPTPVIPASEAAAPAAVPETFRTSLDFLNPPALAPAEQPAEDTRTVIHFLTGVDVDRLRNPVNEDEVFKDVAHPVSVLVYEKCTSAGNDADGQSQCQWGYSSGFTSSMENTHATKDGWLTSHTVLHETNREKTWEGKRTVDYTAQLENSNIVSETYDILYDLGDEESSKDHVITREVLRYTYEEQDGQRHVRSMSWTKYGNEMNTQPRQIDFHAVLVYDENNQPLQGYADKWENGKKVKSLFGWEAEKDISNLSTRELWTMWEKWILNSPAHVFIV